MSSTRTRVFARCVLWVGRVARDPPMMRVPARVQELRLQKLALLPRNTEVTCSADLLNGGGLVSSLSSPCILRVSCVVPLQKERQPCCIVGVVAQHRGGTGGFEVDVCLSSMWMIGLVWWMCVCVPSPCCVVSCCRAAACRHLSIGGAKIWSIVFKQPRG